MRDPKRIRKMCNRLATAWEQFPDLRLGQILSLSEDLHRREKGTYFPLFYIEDEELISYIERRMNTLEEEQLND